MPNTGLAEIYFIAAMMTLILIICAAGVFFFFRTYRKEMRQKELRKKQNEVTKSQKSEVKN